MRNYEDVIGRCDQNPTYLDDAFLVFVVFNDTQDVLVLCSLHNACRCNSRLGRLQRWGKLEVALRDKRQARKDDVRTPCRPTRWTNLPSRRRLHVSDR